MSNAVLSDQTLIEFFTKPHRVTSLTWTTQTFPTALGQVIVPDGIIASNRMLQTRLDYWAGFRGDVVFRITANPSMAQSGKMLFVWIPFDDLQNAKYLASTDSLMSFTQWPKVEFDLASDRTLEFVIPYRLPLPFWPVQLTSALGTRWGALAAMPYTPLRGGGSVAFTVWAYFKPGTVMLLNPTTTTTYTMEQSIEGVKTQSSLMQEIRNADKPVSSALSVASKVATTLTNVPVLGSYIQPVAFATAVASKVASALGWSNPRDERNLMPTYATGVVDQNVTDRPIIANVFAYSAAARLAKVPPAGLTQEDEMHFGHLLPMSTWYKTVTWATTDAVGTKLRDVISVSPIDLGTLTTASFTHRAPYAWIASLFYYWRGSIRLTVKVAKTRFHTGRLLIAYDCDSGASTFDYDETDMLPRMIIDLESGNEWTFEFPFPAFNYYLQAAQPCGVFSVFVLTPLQVAGGASSTVDIVFETSMRPDASFGFPVNFSQQSNGLGPPTESTNAPMSTFKDPSELEMTCMGDACRSFRTMIKRGWWISIASTEGPYFFHANCPFESNDPGPMHNMMNQLSRHYILCRGSMSYAIKEDSAAGVGTVSYCVPELPGTSGPGTTTSQFQALSEGVWTEVQVPQLNPSRWRYIYNASPVSPYSAEMFKYPCVFLTPSNQSTGMYYIVTRAADDFEFSFFTGIYPQAVEASSSTTVALPKQVKTLEIDEEGDLSESTFVALARRLSKKSVGLK